MAARVGFAAALLLGAAGAAAASLPPRAGVSDALLGNWERAYDRLSAAKAPDRAERFFLARALTELGMPARAVEVYSELAKTDGPFSGDALEAAARALFEAGRYGELASLVDQARADRFVDEPRFRYEAGQSYWLAGQAGKAQTQLEKVAPGPFQAYALYTLGQIARSEGRLQEAVEILGRAVEATSGQADRAVASALADRIRVTRGRVVYEAALGSRGLAEADRRKLLEVAKAQFARVSAESFLYPEALRGIGWCTLELTGPADALTAFEGAAELDPAGRYEDQWAQGRAFQRLGYYEEAAKLYAEARVAARERAAELSSREAAPGLADAPWLAALRDLERGRTRLTELAASEKDAALAADRRGTRSTSSLETIASLEERVGRLRADLAALDAGLEGYADALTAPYLFPKSERPRLDALLARQDRLVREVTTLETALERLSVSAVWQRAGAAAQKAAQTLWARLSAAKTALSGSQMAFLEALKARVTNKENELRQAIEARGTELSGLTGLFRSARESIDGEARRLEALRGRLREVVRKREEALGRANELDREVREARQRALLAVGKEEAAGLLLRADRIALDETEALHLWEEKGRPEGKGEIP